MIFGILLPQIQIAAANRCYLIQIVVDIPLAPKSCLEDGTLSMLSLASLWNCRCTVAVCCLGVCLASGFTDLSGTAQKNMQLLKLLPRKAMKISPPRLRLQADPCEISRSLCACLLSWSSFMVGLAQIQLCVISGMDGSCSSWLQRRLGLRLPLNMGLLCICFPL